MGWLSKKEKKEKGKERKSTVVLKTECQCNGCTSKVIDCIKRFDGVDMVDFGEGQTVVVVGEVDPVKLQQKVEKKTHKKVEILSPTTDEDEEEEEPSVTTAVMKLDFHCNGCTKKIYKIVMNTEGFTGMKRDAERQLLTVTGSMDMEELAESLQRRLSRSVEIVPQKEEGRKKKHSGGDKGKEKSKGKEHAPAANPSPVGWMAGGHRIPGPNPYGAPWVPTPNPYGAPWVPTPNPYGAPWVPNPNLYGAPWAPNPNPYGAPHFHNLSPSGAPFHAQ